MHVLIEQITPCAQEYMQQSFYEFCKQNNLQHLLNEWDVDKNGTLTPDLIAHKSRKRIWWKCAQGHSWASVAYSRIGGNGCPICSNKIVSPGVNDLATTHPHLAAQWHPEKNGSLTPQQVVYGSDRKVWWICEKGHEWISTVKNRTKGRSCPVCTNKVVISGANDLASHFPEIAAQWQKEKNGDLRPDQVSPGSNRSVWWECEKGHHWRAAVAGRTQRDRGCPYCTSRYLLTGFNDLATLRPDVAKEWHPTLNGTLTSEQVTSKSNKSVWWQCADGHVWKAYICNRTAKQPTGCPVCAGNISAAKRRHYEKIAEQLALEAVLSNKDTSGNAEGSTSNQAETDQTKERTS